MSQSADAWLKRVQSSAAGEPLLALIQSRLMNPYTEGPLLSDRQGEGPEEVFERLAGESEAFRDRLEQTIAGFFRSEAADAFDTQGYALLYAMLLMAEKLTLTGIFAPLRAWLERHAERLRDDEYFGLASTALKALAVAQPRGLREVRDLWLKWWNKAPSSAWLPSIFIGLRLQDPQTAVNHLEELLSKANDLQQDPGPLLHGLWNQAEAQPLLHQWLRDPNHAGAAQQVRAKLQERLDPCEWGKLPERPRRRQLPSLAGAGRQRMVEAGR